jgi:predicted lipoprotein with Yx(FWY)xxD motif
MNGRTCNQQVGINNMRALAFPVMLASTLFLALNVASHADETVPKTANTNLPYPIEVSLVDESPHGFTYRQSSTGLPLYISEKDAPEKSNCYSGCATQWIPLQAPAKAKALGEWSVVKRNDGTRQWAFKGRPIYTHIHDTPQISNEDAGDEIWHILPHFAGSTAP